MGRKSLFKNAVCGFIGITVGFALALVTANQGNQGEALFISLDESRLTSSLPSITLTDSIGRSINVQLIDPYGPLAKLERKANVAQSGIDYEVNIMVDDFTAVGVNKYVLISGTGKWTANDVSKILDRISVMLQD